MAPKHLLFDAAALLLLLLPSGSSTTAVEYSKKGRDYPVKESGVEAIPDPVVRGEPATVKMIYYYTAGNQSVHCQRVAKPEKEGIHSYFVSPSAMETIKKILRFRDLSDMAIVAGGVWESLWLFLLTDPYDKLSKAQYSCQVKLTALASPEWRLVTGVLICLSLRAFIRIWITGRWVAVVLVTWIEAEKTGPSFWSFKTSRRTAACAFLMIFQKFLFLKAIRLITALKGLWRQLSRHGRHESSTLELSGRGRPSQS